MAVMMQEVLKEIIRDTITPLFKVEGFQRKGNNFARSHIDFSATVNIQSSRWSTRDTVEFFFNTGIYTEKLFGTLYTYQPPAFPMEIDSLLRIRGTELTGNYEWYKLTEDTDFAQLKQWITEDLQLYIFPYFRRLNSMESVIRELELREQAGKYENPHYLTVLYASSGDKDKARERMNRELNNKQSNAMQQRFAQELALRLG